jgi:hypothetical protein
MSVDPAIAKAEAQRKVDAQRLRLKRLWPEEMADGERCAFHQSYPGEREKGGYPKGFHGWPLERRNAWYCGFNLGLIERQELERGDG